MQETTNDIIKFGLFISIPEISMEQAWEIANAHSSGHEAVARKIAEFELSALDSTVVRVQTAQWENEVLRQLENPDDASGPDNRARDQIDKELAISHEFVGWRVENHRDSFDVAYDRLFMTQLMGEDSDWVDNSKLAMAFRALQIQRQLAQEVWAYFELLSQLDAEGKLNDVGDWEDDVRWQLFDDSFEICKQHFQVTQRIEPDHVMTLPDINDEKNLAYNDALLLSEEIPSTPREWDGFIDLYTYTLFDENSDFSFEAEGFPWGFVEYVRVVGRLVDLPDDIELNLQ